MESKKLGNKPVESEVVKLRQRITELRDHVAFLEKKLIEKSKSSKVPSGNGLRYKSHDLVIGLLGLLSIRDMWGYEVYNRFRLAIEPFWATPPTQVYPRLRAMEKEGLVLSTNVIQGARPNKRVYSITGKGREVLKEWLKQPITWPVMRHDFMLHLFLFDNVTIDEAKRTIEAYRDLIRGELERGRIVENKLQPALEGPYARTIAYQLQSLEHLMRITKTELEGTEKFLQWLSDKETQPGHNESEENKPPLEAWIRS